MTEDADGCWKFTRSPAPIEKLCQLIAALSVDCRMSSRVDEVGVMVALPPTTVPFCGIAWAAPTIRADAETPASRPAISGRRVERSVGTSNDGRRRLRSARHSGHRARRERSARAARRAALLIGCP